MYKYTKIKFKYHARNLPDAEGVQLWSKIYMNMPETKEKIERSRMKT